MVTATVVELATAVICPACGQPATWQVGSSVRSCTTHLGDVLAELYAADPHPFAPHLPRPMFRGNW